MADTAAAVIFIPVTRYSTFGACRAESSLESEPVTSHPIRITLLVNNRAEQPLREEHGLSLWIEVDSLHVLFDTGQGDALSENAARLGFSLERITHGVLSHGHYDHIGGVTQVRQRAPGARWIFTLRPWLPGGAAGRATIQSPSGCRNPP